MSLQILIVQKWTKFLQKNHLAGLKSKFLRISFPSMAEMAQFKKKLMPQINKNRQALEKSTEYTTILAEYMGVGRADRNYDVGPLEQIIDIRFAKNFI